MVDGNTFAGKTACVTGAAGNLGQAVAMAFASAGAHVLLLDRDRATTDWAAELPGSAQAITVDLLDRNAVESSLAEFATIEHLSNIAGGFAMGDPVHGTSEDTWNFLFDINARTVANTASVVVPKMLAAGGGSIVNVGAKAALAGTANMGAYCASKSVVLRLTESMSAELKGKGINVNCIMPSAIDTPQNREAMPNADTSKWVAPDALADVALFLASDGARAVHGACIPVTGLS
jgi:NAD(P)-dependent dehydrogenase (short-subunit alcohol dehydrogenase family)